MREHGTLQTLAAKIVVARSSMIVVNGQLVQRKMRRQRVWQWYHAWEVARVEPLILETTIRRIA